MLLKKTFFFHTIALLLFLPPHTNASTPPLTQFPEQRRLWLSISKGRVTPAQTQKITINTPGYLEIKAPNNSPIQKNEVWGIKNPKRLELKKQSLAIDKKQLAEKLKQLELDHSDSISSMEDKVSSLHNELAKLQSARNNPELQSQKKIIQQINKAKNRLQAQISRTSQRLDSLKNRTELAPLISKLKLDYTSKENALIELKKTSELQAEFEGTLQYQIQELTEQKTLPFTLWIKSGTLVGTIINNNRYEVTVKTFNPSISQVPKHTLFLEINPHDKKRKIRAIYSRTENETSSSEFSSPELIFSIAKSDTTKAQNLQGSQPLIHIYTQLPKGCRIIPKTFILKYLAQQTTQPSWEKAVHLIWPQSTLIAIGKSTLAILPNVASKK